MQKDPTPAMAPEGALPQHALLSEDAPTHTSAPQQATNPEGGPPIPQDPFGPPQPERHYPVSHRYQDTADRIKAENDAARRAYRREQFGKFYARFVQPTVVAATNVGRRAYGVYDRAATRVGESRWAVGLQRSVQASPLDLPQYRARRSESLATRLENRWNARPESTVREPLFSRAVPERPHTARHARTDNVRAVRNPNHRPSHSATSSGLAGVAKTGLRITGIEYGVTAGAQRLVEGARATKDLAVLARIGAYMASVRTREGIDHIGQTLGKRWQQIKEQVIEHAGQRAWPNKKGVKHIIGSTAVLAGGVTLRGTKRATRAVGVRAGKAFHWAGDRLPQPEPADIKA